MKERALKIERGDKANALLTCIAMGGRHFFHHEDRIARFEVDERGRIWFRDAYTQRRVYVALNTRWRGFTNGGTLRTLVERLYEFIRTGKPQPLNLGPWPETLGDLWGYGPYMVEVRDCAVALGLVA